MALKRYPLPNGALYVNTSKGTIEGLIDNGVPVDILPGKAYLSGGMRGVPLEEYFACPEIWDAKLEVYEAIEKKGKTVVAIDARGVGKFGDQILLTILPKAYRESWEGKAIVDVLAPKGFEEIWENNPYVRNVSTKLDEKNDYDKVIDVTTLGLKFRRPEHVNCADAILSGLGLTLINKTPVLVLTDEEKEWAKEQLKKDEKRMKPGPLIGVSLYSGVKSRTYPHMWKVVDELIKKEYNICVLDYKNDDGSYLFGTFRNMVAMANECDFILTTDSAILHVAGALKKRVLSIHAYTEGKVFTESYEKSSFIQAPCPLGKDPCWWKIECIPGSDHLAKTNKDYAHCLKELDPKVVIERVVEAMSEPTKLFLLMLTYSALDMTKKAVESLRSKHDYELFIVDNDSTDGTKKWLKERGINFVSKKTSAAEAQNIGLKQFLESDCSHLMLMNNDIVLRYDAIDRLVKCAEQSGARGVMSTEAGPPWALDSVQPKDEEWDEISKIPAGSFSATLFTRECIESVGLFNERYRPRYIEDNDYALRLRASGGKFVRAHAALFYHVLGVVVKTVEKGKSRALDGESYWLNNIKTFYELYGIHPHSSQDLNLLGLEWHREDWYVKIKDFLKTHDKARIRIERDAGGFGDILFSTVIAKALKHLFPGKLEINYFVRKEFASLLKHNPNIDGIYSVSHKLDNDFRINLTDLEWRVEQQEELTPGLGEIVSARTEIYLDVLGLSEHLPKGNWLLPDYFVTGEEKKWANTIWGDIIQKGDEKGEKRIVVIMKGSNKFKIWPKMGDLVTELYMKGHKIIRLDEMGFNFRKAAALVSTADLVVAPDTGISNLAGALNIPVVTIFSNRNGENFTKMFKSMVPIQGCCPHNEENYCGFQAPCFPGLPHRDKENIDIPQCLKDLKVDTVLGEIIRISEKTDEEELRKFNKRKRLLKDVIYGDD